MNILKKITAYIDWAHPWIQISISCNAKTKNTISELLMRKITPVIENRGDKKPALRFYLGKDF